MQRWPKIKSLATAIKENQSLWQRKIQDCWKAGHQAGFGFAIGDHFDTAAEALVKEGYYLIAEIDDIAIGTNWLDSIVAVTNHYGPWAVDISENLLNNSSNTNLFISKTTKATKTKNKTTPTNTTQ
jgi:hypothetical protein